MNFNQLEYFCTAVECGSITKAAKKLFVTQPAISGAIRELEKEFSVTLFSHTRSISPTLHAWAKQPLLSAGKSPS